MYAILFGDTMTILYAVILFLGSQTFLIRKVDADKIKKLRLRYLLLVTVILIGAAVFIGRWFSMGYWLVITVTILSSSILINKIQSQAEEME